MQRIYFKNYMELYKIYFEYIKLSVEMTYN